MSNRDFRRVGGLRMRLADRWGPLLLCRFIKVTDGDGDRGRDSAYLINGLDGVSVKGN
jgi:hypothetical protein